MQNTNNFLENYKVISLIGMCKNAGKTTTLNYLLDNLMDKKVALTSIGRDGEPVDVVTSTYKPSIFIKKGDIVATAQDCLRNCDITINILETTDIHTPLGRIIVVEALSGGFVDVAGPSFNAQLIDLVKILEKYSPDKIFIDGALSRKGLADSFVSEATILSTGASYDNDMEKTVNDTKLLEDLLTLPKVDKKLEELLTNDQSSVVLIDKDYNKTILNLATAITAGKEIMEAVDENTTTIFVRGAITNNIVDAIVANRQKFKQLDFIVTNGTKFFIDEKRLMRLRACNITLKALYETKLLFITYNPFSAYGNHYNTERFKESLESVIKTKLMNVMEVKHG